MAPYIFSALFPYKKGIFDLISSSAPGSSLSSFPFPEKFLFCINAKEVYCKGSVNADERWDNFKFLVEYGTVKTLWRRWGSKNIHFDPPEIVSGSFQSFLLTVITSNPESNCTCRQKLHSFFQLDIHRRDEDYNDIFGCDVGKISTLMYTAPPERTYLLCSFVRSSCHWFHALISSITRGSEITEHSVGVFP